MASAPDVEPKGKSRAMTDGPSKLAELIEGEIIPRLLMAHRRETVAPSAYGQLSPVPPSDQDISTLVELALDQEAIVLIRHVDQALNRGVTVESLLIDYLAPAARVIGTMWESDEVDFVDVTMALWRLQEVVHDLAARSPGAGVSPDRARRALFTLPPGGQHSFGTVLIDECFRRRGWDTMCMTQPSESELVKLAGDRWFDFIGLTVSCDHQIDDLPRLIGVLRAASRNPRVGILVGGRVFVESPALALRVGADATAPDARAAVDRAETWLEAFEQRAAIPI